MCCVLICCGSKEKTVGNSVFLLLQIDPKKRPAFEEIESQMLTIYKTLESDNLTRTGTERRNSTGKTLNNLILYVTNGLSH